MKVWVTIFVWKEEGTERKKDALKTSVILYVIVFAKF
jgi:hypothetical protein